jgi:hypothetical protein
LEIIIYSIFSSDLEKFGNPIARIMFLDIFPKVIRQAAGQDMLHHANQITLETVIGIFGFIVLAKSNPYMVIDDL